MVLLCATACGGSGGPDLPDGGGDADGDGGNLVAGVSVELVTVPELPGSFSSDFDPSAISELRVQLSDIRVVGDAMPAPIGPRDFEFETVPEHVNFENAPIGRYSRFRARINEFEASGTLEIDGESEPWEIEDEPPGGLDIDLSIDLDLEPGEVGRVTIELDFSRVFTAIDWNAVDDASSGDTLIVDEDSPEIDEVRAKLVEMFRLGESDDD